MKAAFTIVTSNYLAQAKTLADSFMQRNREYDFYICLLDKVNERFQISDFEPHKIVEVEALQISFFTELYERYDMFELSNALKPYFADYLIKLSEDSGIVMYLDSDMMVFDSFSHIEDCLKENAICFTPHILTTIPKDDFLPDETSFLNSGIYNGGFFAFSIEEESKKFIEWWKEKLRYYCFHNVCSGQFVDQIWLNLVPLFFNKVSVIKHPGYNVAYYNLHERRVSVTEGRFFVNEKYPLVLYHYTGYNPSNPQIISRYQTRFSFDYRSDIKPLYALYSSELEKNLHSHYSGFIPFYKGLREIKLSYKEQQLKEKEQNQKAEVANFITSVLPSAINKFLIEHTFYGKLVRLKSKLFKKKN